MIDPKDLLHRLEKRQAEYDRSSLTNPGDKSAFTYGRACGLHAGFNLVRDEILLMLKEEKEDDGKL